MNSDKPKTPREELEASLTAMLLGELPAEKAAALRELMAKDAELARLHERLEEAIGLVRETASVPEEEKVGQPALKMSGKKREELFAHFKTVAPKEFAKPQRREIRVWEIAVAAGIVAFIGIAAWLTFSLTQQSFSLTSRIKQDDVAESSREVTDMVARDFAQLTKKRPPSKVGSITEQTTARLAAENGLDMAQDAIIASGGGRSSLNLGSAPQTIFDEPNAKVRGEFVVSQSAGKRGFNEIVLPTSTDHEPNPGVSSPSTFNYATHDTTFAPPAVVAAPTPNGASGQKPSRKDASELAIQDDDVYQRRYGMRGADSGNSRNGKVELAEGSVQQLSRSKIQEPLENSAQNRPVENKSGIDPATGLPIPIPELQPKAAQEDVGGLRPLTPTTPEPIGDPQWVGVLERPPVHSSTNRFVSRSASIVAPSNSSESAGAPIVAFQPPIPQSGTPGNFTTGIMNQDAANFLDAIRDGGQKPQSKFDDSIKSVADAEQMRARTLREAAARVPAQTASSPSTPMAGEKLADLGPGKDASGSTVYLGAELAKADTQFGAWALDSDVDRGRVGGTKKEEESLKRMGEVADATTTGGRAASPETGFYLLGPKEMPEQTVNLAFESNGLTQPDMTKSLGQDTEKVGALGDVPMLGRLFNKGSEVKASATDSLSANSRLSVSQTNLETFGGIISGVPATNLSGYVNGNGQWQFTTNNSNQPTIANIGDVPLVATEPAFSSPFAEKLVAAGTNTKSYDRYTFYRNLGQLGVEGDKEPGSKAALSYTTVPSAIPLGGTFTNAIVGISGHDSDEVNLWAATRSDLSASVRSENKESQWGAGTNQPYSLNVVGYLDLPVSATNIPRLVAGEERENEQRVELARNNESPKELASAYEQKKRESEKQATDAEKSRNFVTHRIKVDTNAFLQGLQSVDGIVVGGFTVAGGGAVSPEVGGIGGGRADNGIHVVTRTNDMTTLQTSVRRFFKTMGVDLNTGDGKSVFYNDRDGTLLVRGTPEDLDVIESAVSVLSLTPPPVTTNKAQIAELTENYYLGGILDTNNRRESRSAGVPNAYARTNLVYTGSGRKTVWRKLDQIRVDSLKYEGLPLNDVIRNLNEEAKKLDPEKRGINFILNPSQTGNSVTSTVSPTVDPATGLPTAPANGAVDLGTAKVKLAPELRDVRLADVLDAIVKTSDKPIRYSIEDYAVVFSRAGTAADWEDPKVSPKSPTPALIPQPEVQTRENAFSTFSLNVSDVAFKLAGASLEKGQMPDAGSIRSEEFINAFDYRDPEAVLPARGKTGVPVAFAWERTRYPFAQNRDLLRFSIKTAAQGRQAGRPLNLVLLLDNSGSMERADRVAIIREALKVLASQLQPQDKLSVITFARTAQLRVDGAAGNQAAQVAEEIGGLTPEGGTNIEEAMNLAYQTALRHYLANGINRVVLLTDGAANLGNVEPETLKQKVEENRKQGVATDCFGIGWEGFNDDLLEALSRNGDGRYGFINTPEEATTEFAGQLAGALNVAASDVKVQVEFNPARVTAYRQIGYAKHQLTKEQFRDNTVDAAEIAAQEAGNALYAIEVNPAGQGPLGTVRVRFKVPGTSDYREHEWTVPFNGNAVTLEQASPAMRLAATASAFSEWLASSPYATEVTPDTLLRYLGGVPEVYGADERPKKLEWMIRQAKSIAGNETRNSTTDEHR